MSSLLEIPEVAGLDTKRSLVRIPPELDVPLTSRVRQLIDTPEFRRLARISQLGLVSLVYPAALHTRFEHCLGVYRLALLLLKQLAHDGRFREAVRPEDGELFLAAALLHDLGHWPFCHPIEDLRLLSVPSHELFANSFLLEGEIADVLRHDWKINPREVVALLSEKQQDRTGRILSSMLSGPIDIDKMDYLFRDSLHAGVPYGRNFDQQRLIGSLCLDESASGLAITEKGKTAAELMVFARYVMFSEVYWHHAVRSATAMLQRAFYLLHGDLELDRLFRAVEPEMIQMLLRIADDSPAGELLGGLFGPSRRLYKRLAQYSFFEQGELYRRLAGRPYPWLATCAEHFASIASTALGRVIAPHEVLFDAPPVEREVEFQVDVYYVKEDRYRPLSEVSPVVRSLAQEQFDDYVKRVRIFTHPRVAESLQDLAHLPELVAEAVDRMD
ncbi:MAG: HD domain-containing protein [Pirellulales bacterium]|jgi:HD superfamily phosphohydrolase|nr:HD domain-containing protein [Thermoguttaceae bacterium]MDD4788384.1 HD domain-containing protein [Pirellulales bacterium]MDI9443746.1 HD domain-containing protein [Planctomycetota bacterium]NLZ00190.1 HD domain-containing protein [Pirellulaceae bacterium]